MRSRSALGPIEIRPVDAGLADRLGRFLEAVQAAGEETRFHPHPLTAQAARAIAGGRGQDVYLVACGHDEILAYGMLRGWDEGFEIPSLGIAVHPAYRRLGLGRLMMDALHDTARRRGASRVRLTVDADHHAAKVLYVSLGYRFEPMSGGRLVGWLDLAPDESTT